MSLAFSVSYVSAQTLLSYSFLFTIFISSRTRPRPRLATAHARARLSAPLLVYILQVGVSRWLLFFLSLPPVISSSSRPHPLVLLHKKTGQLVLPSCIYNRQPLPQLQWNSSVFSTFFSFSLILHSSLSLAIAYSCRTSHRADG